MTEGLERLNGNLGVYEQFDQEIRKDFFKKFNKTLGNITEAYLSKQDYSKKLGGFNYTIYYNSDLGDVEAQIIIRYFLDYIEFRSFKLLNPPADWLKTHQFQPQAQAQTQPEPQPQPQP